MKFKMLFIFLIGMISMTAMASTPQLEQKQKATIQKSLEPFQIVENVQIVAFETIETTTIKMPGTSLSFVIKERVIQHLAIIDDVGWSIKRHQAAITPYFEKMQLKHLPDLRNQIRKTGIPSAREQC